MENTEKTIPTTRPDETTREVTPGCPFWIFGKEKDAQEDLDKHLEVID